VIPRQYQMIRVGAADGVATITLHNPSRKNAIGPLMVNELLHALDDALAHDEVRAVVITGEGDAFCAGGDFAQMTGGATGEAALPPKGDYADLLVAMTRSTKPIVARVNGHALGGGLGIVAASHFAIAAVGARLGTPEVNVGLFPMMIMAVLQRVVPRRRLLEMMIFGERLEAHEAAAIGLVNRAVDMDDLDRVVDEITDKIKSKSPITLRLGLEAFAAQDDLDLETALPLLRERLAGCLATDDAREGLMAFLEKRKPMWTGK
jgi:enoyl-CoA hydratase/carnithine racemase